MSDAQAVAGQSHYRHTKRGQRAADVLVDAAAHRVRDWWLRTKRYAGVSDHALNDLAYPQNAQLRSAMEHLEKARINAYRAIHLESRKDTSTENSIRAEGQRQAALIEAIGVKGAPVWYGSDSTKTVSTVGGYVGGTHSLERPISPHQWTGTIVVTNPTVEGMTVEHMGGIWLDYVSHVQPWEVSERSTPTSLILTVTGYGRVGDSVTLDMIARNNIGPSRLKLTITVTNPQPAAE